MRRVLLSLFVLAATPAHGGEPAPTRTAAAHGIMRDAVDRLERAGFGIELGVAVMVEGEGTIFTDDAETPRPAASAVKSFVALDLLLEHAADLHRVPAGVERLLEPRSHPAFRGFSEAELARSRAALRGLSWMELARIMMGRTAHQNDVYNAACNVLMVKLGGPPAIVGRLRRLDPAFVDVDLNRYMVDWDGAGDNRVSPRALVELYRRAARGDLFGMDPARVAAFRELLRDGETAGEDVYEKAGTLYPDPMVRVRAGYEERGDRDLVYAIMGEMRNDRGLAPEDAFVLLLAAVDTLTVICRELP